MNFAVNYLAVLGAAIAGAVINAAWYSGIFAKQVNALRAADPTIAGRAPAPPMYGVALAAQLVMAFTLAVFLKTLGFSGWSSGLMVGFFAWLGFTATALGVVETFGYRPVRFLLVDAGNWLVTLLAMGALLGSFG